MAKDDIPRLGTLTVCKEKEKLEMKAQTRTPIGLSTHSAWKQRRVVPDLASRR